MLLILHIKKKQLLGTEYQAKIFALACSNMFIHQDGKTNLEIGDCFDNSIISKIKDKHPTVGLLNPPYKSDKKKDKEELLFVLNNLNCLEQGGKCIAIVPMQSALAQKGKIFLLKEELLKKHTLEAVFSMPGELFFNSNVGVVSCVMIFTAKRPHPKNKKTFFGYFKDDGFAKRKNKGRIDEFGKWRDISDSWLESYTNRDDIPGLSINRSVSAEDEWCAEAYMETDYSQLKLRDFEDTVLDYVTFLYNNRLL